MECILERLSKETGQPKAHVEEKFEEFYREKHPLPFRYDTLVIESFIANNHSEAAEICFEVCNEIAENSLPKEFIISPRETV